ncbi:unnamed protein product [Owenia fusiformis]|uniref:Uncharacterized protein n=1 Tax=Owenia fusiformis TaxID=6347 RepID=A0A8J1T526_OWEFU|nr:unnamed protein product [Owenia fusiformis]
MGGSSSTTRKVTVEESEGNGVVKISEDVVRRLKGESTVPVIGDKSERLSGIEVLDRKKHDKEMKNLQAYYEERLQYLEQMNSQLYQTTTDQFAKAVQEVEQKFLKQTSSPVCQELQSEVVACYNANPKQTLLCSAQIKAFTDCVDKYRQNKLTRGNGGV